MQKDANDFFMGLVSSIIPKIEDGAIFELAQCLGVRDSTALAIDLRKWMSEVALSAIFEDHVNPFCLVLWGAQGVGKSRFLRLITPESLMYSQVGLNSPEFLAGLAGDFMVEIDDFESFENLEKVMTFSTVRVRMPFTLKQGAYKRTGALAATCNYDPGLLTESFLVHRVVGSDFSPITCRLVEQAWREALLFAIDNYRNDVELISTI